MRPTTMRKIVQESFEEYELKMCNFPRSQPDQASVGCAGWTSLMHGDPTLLFTGFKVSALNILVPDTTYTFRGLVESMSQ